jgi:hypothetical protein
VSAVVEVCGPKWPGCGLKTTRSQELEASHSVLLQQYSRVERVTGIEPALSAWELFELMGFVRGSLRASWS